MSPPICYVDSEAWGDQITLTQTYQSDTTDPDTKVETVVSGTATFTYTRAKVADLALRRQPAVLLCHLGDCRVGSA